MKVLCGRTVSNSLRERISQDIQRLNGTPGLAVVLVGDDPASQVYVKNKHLACESVGMNSWIHRLPQDVARSDLKKLIEKLNSDDEVDGILVQLPLPKEFDQDEVLSWISPLKDPDCLTLENIGLLWTGKPRVLPCTPAGIIEILKHYDYEISGKKCTVIGRSQIVGMPMVALLQNENATVTLCHSKTKDLKSATLNADITVVAAGKPQFLDETYFSKDAVVIDVGIHRNEDRLCGDVDFNQVKDSVAAITPVPGGVGPMTITMLLQNTLILHSLKSVN